MKTRYIVLSAFVAAFLSNGLKAFAQKNTYSNVTINHKISQFYNTTYQNNNRRSEQTDPYANDTFDDESEGWAKEPVGGNKVQKTHEYRMVIYMEPGTTRTLYLPGNMENTHLSMFNYQRWYDYSTDSRSDQISVSRLSNNGNKNNRDYSIDYEETSYNFSNGLVGGNFINDVPDNVFDYDVALTKVRFTMPENESVYYLACDVSNYTDDVSRPISNSGSINEPTLSQRVIFEIHDASEMRNQLKNCTGNTYLETYDYHYPAKRITSKTAEQVALRLEAQNYYCPGETGGEAGDLTYEVVGGEDYVTGKGTLSGTDRVISFNVNNENYSEKNRNVQIKVYKKGRDGITYNVALFNLTFDENTEGLAQSQLAAISSSSERYKRTNEYLDKAYTLITRLDMDYENIVYGSQYRETDYHPYPMDWTYSSYGAYVSQNNKSSNPQWGEYGITRVFPFHDTEGHTRLNATGYHLYLDANELPGTICKLPFRENLCAGARLYVTAYVKSLGNNANQCDASLLFIVKGVDADGNEETLYTQASGQIPRNLNNGNPEWFQVYFSYSNGNKVYDHYILQLENNCANTRGADMCLDDIRVYMNPLHVEAKTVEPVCNEDKDVDVQLRLNYEMLVNRLGMTEGADEEKSGYYSFLNKDVFDREFADNGDNYRKAFEAALVKGDGIYNSGSQWYGAFTFNSDFEQNGDEQGRPTNDEAGREDPGQDEDRIIYFTSSISANSGVTQSLVPGETYYIVYNASTFDPSNATSIANIADMYDFSSICTVKGEFLVEGPLIIRINGDVQSEAETSCVGQIPLVNVELRDGLQGGGVVEDAVFDWYFGDITSFAEEKTESGIDLETALANFRYFYPDVTSVTENIVPRNEDTWVLTQEEIDFIKSMNEDYGASGSNPKLTLSASSDLTIRLLQAETDVVLIPIGTKPSEDIKICWEPTQFTLYAQDTAPSLTVGRTDVIYPEGAYPQGSGVSVRMDLAQYNDITNGLGPLTVPVRDPKLGDDDAIVTQVDSQPEMYLIGTNDPDYKDKVGNGFEYIVGNVEDFTISPEEPAFSSAVQLSFDKSRLAMKEGYEYDVTFRFKTAGSSERPDEDTDLLCFGNLVVPFKIVPEYQVWIGGKDGNWNNDNNWRRADYTDLNKTVGNYLSNAANGTSNGFAPMMSTKIVMPELTADGQGQIELYAPVFTTVFDITINKPKHIGEETHLIEYDVVVRPRGSAEGIKTPYFAGRYYTNHCDQVHFNANSEMLHSELLTHNKAWTDVEMPVRQWTSVSTPINGVYSGDWYTKTSGTEDAEYFEPLTWNDRDNNRLKPMMTQRSWDGNASVVGNNAVQSAVVSDVTWSSTFNAVDVPYTPGKGFSIHANMGSSYNDNVKFRFPKSDTSYSGFNASLYRNADDYGKLATSVMADLGPGGEFDEDETKPYEVSVTPSQDGNYLMLGNPFVAQLDMAKFLTANSGVLLNEYWATNGNGDPLSGVVDENGESWLTSDGVSNALVPPYTAFYVKLNDESTEEKTITFTRDMAALKPSATTETQSLQGMTLLAAGAKGNSTALLRYDAAADNGYAKSEDVQLMRESAGTAAPLVYTVAGDMAANINQVKDLQQIPLGLFAADGDVTTLTFTGTDALLEPSLYDAEMNTDTPLTEGYTLTVNGASHGRYFIRAKGAGEGTTGITDVETGDGGVSVYSVTPRQVVVSSGAELLEVSVYSVGGAMLGHESVGGGRTAVTLDGIDSGVAVVRVVTADGQTTRKLVVK